MFSLDIIYFLSPYSGKLEILPVVFFLIILFLFVFTVVNLYKNANQENWERNWVSKKLDIEKGSLSELSQNIASKSEYVADAMPGIILIVGLLGTFIGLGLALDKASNILSSADMNNVDGSMGQLMQMMEGLGTKFKTSTWGLIAFLLLKFISARNNYDERRLTWTSIKVKSILENSRQEYLSSLEKRQEDLLISISKLTEKLEKSQEENRKSNENLLSGVIEQQSKTSTATQEANNLAHKVLRDSLNGLFNQLLDNQAKISQNNTQLLERISSKQITLLDQQHTEFKETTNTMAKVISGTIDSSFAKLLSQQLEHSKDNQESLKELTQEICNSIQASQECIIEAVDKNSAFLEKTAQESEKTRNAMDKFVNESLKTIDSLKESAGGMSQAAKDMGDSAKDIGDSATKLQTVIDSLADEMDKLMSQMKNDLGETISKMDQSFVANMDKMTRNLNATIGDMNKSFKQNMVEMSKNLERATTDISQAVKQLSKSVDDTMTNVSNTINKSMDLQKNAQLVFVATSDNLNEHVIKMTNLVDKLSGDITSGLAAVSASNRSMTSLDKRYNTTLDRIADLVSALQQISEKLNER
ncbi:hypothetical protein ACFBZI_02585 [Moraxella sp. ZJ142]|uniref:hypothetical protein n=1 Tax=Moraxella marmotae TaxID=3344520 RepID=UPI0035D4582F